MSLKLWGGYKKMDLYNGFPGMAEKRIRGNIGPAMKQEPVCWRQGKEKVTEVNFPPGGLDRFR